MSIFHQHIFLWRNKINNLDTHLSDALRKLVGWFRVNPCPAE